MKLLCFETQNQVNIALTNSVHSMIPVVEISQFINARLKVKTIGGKKQQREKERTRNREKSVRDSVQLERVVASLINLTVSQIPMSSVTDNP